MNDHPTLGQALRLLDHELRSVLSGPLDRWNERHFVGATFWTMGIRHGSVREKVLLVPGMIDDQVAASLVDAVSNGASAIVVAEAAATGVSEIPELAGFSLALVNGADWSDVSATLRGLCPPGFANETAGLRRGDLFSLAQSLATLAGGAVSIVDTAGRIVGYSTLPDQPIDETRRLSTLSLREAEPLSEDREHRLVMRSRGAMALPPKVGRLGRVALPVRSRGELLGSVWLIVDDPEREPAAVSFLDSVAGVTAHHMLEARDLEDAEGARDADLLRTLMEDDGVRFSAAAELGLRAGMEYRAVSFTANETSDINPVLTSRRQVHQVWLIARSLFSWCRVAVLGDEVVALITPAETERAKTFAERVLTVSSMPSVAGIGTPGRTPTELANSMRESIAIAQLLGREGRRGTQSERVAVLDDVRERLGLERLLRNIDSTGVLVGDALDQLDRFDAESSSDLASTVATYLKALGSISKCAALLHLHPNTVRYRLEQVRLLGIDLDDPEVRLWLWARLTAREFQNA